MGSPFKKMTTSFDETALDHLHMGLMAKGFSGDAIVYRNTYDVALARLALLTSDLTRNFAFVAHPNDRFCLIVPRKPEDEAIIRHRVDGLRGTILPMLN